MGLKRLAIAATLATAVAFSTGMVPMASAATPKPIREANEKIEANMAQHSKELAEIDAQYVPRIEKLKTRIETLKSEGINPDTRAEYFENAWYTLPGLLAHLQNKKVEAINASVQRTDTANAKVASDRDSELKDGAVLQGAVDVVTLPSKILADVVGRPEAAHIDTYEIKDGKPLGGSGALAPKFRDDVLRTVGVDPNKHKNNTAVKIVRDPIGAINDLF